MSKNLCMLWPEFVKQCSEFIEIAQKLNDSWSWIIKDNGEGQAYLKYTKKVYEGSDNELIHLEYHVVYSISYQVPVLYTQAHRHDGKLLTLEEMWQLFKMDATFKREQVLSILTQMEHPVLYKPFFCIHPCRTAELLAQTPQSENLIITYVSVMGPYVRLQLDPAYGIGNKA